MPQAELQLYTDELSRDRAFSRLSHDEQMAALAHIEAFALARARELPPPADDAALAALVEQMGVAVTIEEEDPGVPILAEYTEHSRSISIYSTRIQPVEAAATARHPALFSRFSLTAMALAHELFHHLEHVHNGGTGRLLYLPGKLGGILPIRRAVPRAGEVGAHLFVKALLRLSHSPLEIITAGEQSPKTVQEGYYDSV